MEMHSFSNCSFFGGRTVRYCALLLSVAISWIPCNAAQASIDSLIRYAGNIHQFNSIFPQEKVYLQFDNTSYYAGETIWFKAFVTSASDLSRAQSKVLYVDLISPQRELLTIDLSSSCPLCPSPWQRLISLLSALWL